MGSKVSHAAVYFVAKGTKGQSRKMPLSTKGFASRTTTKAVMVIYKDIGDLVSVTLSIEGKDTSSGIHIAELTVSAPGARVFRWLTWAWLKKSSNSVTALTFKVADAYPLVLADATKGKVISGTFTLATSMHRWAASSETITATLYGSSGHTRPIRLGSNWKKGPSTLLPSSDYSQFPSTCSSLLLVFGCSNVAC